MQIRATLDLSPATGERRSSARRRLRLDAQGSIRDREAISVAIRDLSQTGMLVETAAALSIGESLHVILPETDPVEAQVVWNSGRSYGCAFARPIPAAALSAAMLLSAPDSPDATIPDPATELQDLRARVREIAELLDQALDLFQGRGSRPN